MARRSAEDLLGVAQLLVAELKPQADALEAEYDPTGDELAHEASLAARSPSGAWALRQALSARLTSACIAAPGQQDQDCGEHDQG